MFPNAEAVCQHSVLAKFGLFLAGLRLKTSSRRAVYTGLTIGGKLDFSNPRLCDRSQRSMPKPAFSRAPGQLNSNQRLSRLI
jgi:hypothetical protein